MRAIKKKETSLVEIKDNKTLQQIKVSGWTESYLHGEPG